MKKTEAEKKFSTVDQVYRSFISGYSPKNNGVSTNDTAGKLLAKRLLRKFKTAIKNNPK